MRKVWRVLTEASSSIRQSDKRQQARIISSILILLFCIIIFMLIFFGGVFPTSITLSKITIVGIVEAILIGAYINSRTDRYIWSAGLTILILSSAIIYLAFSINIHLLYLLLLPIFLSTIFFPILWVIAFTCLNVIVPSLLTLVSSRIDFVDIYLSPLGIMSLVLGFFIYTLFYRSRVNTETRRELTEKIERFQTLLDTSYSGVCVHTNGEILDANQGFARLFGYNLSDMVGFPFVGIFPEEGRDYSLTGLDAHLDETVETSGVRKDGSKIHVELVSKVQTYQGRIVNACAVRDISEQVEAQSALRDQKSFLDEILTGVQEGVGQVDENGKIIFCNPAMAGIFDQEVEELVGSELFEFISDEAQLNKVKNAYKKQKMENYSFEAPIITVENTEKVIRVTLSPRINGTGDYQGTIGAVIDITSRVKAEKALGEREQLYRGLFERANDAILLMDLDGVYFSVNQKAADMLGYSQDELIYKKPREIVADKGTTNTLNEIKKLLSGESPPLIERNYKRKDGSVLSVEINASLIFGPDGNPLCVQSIVRDITERKKRTSQIKLQLERLNALNEIGGAISSTLDLRQILHMVLEHVTAQLNVDAANILLISANSRKLECAARRGFQTGALQHTRLSLGESYAGKAAMENKTLHVPNFGEEMGDLDRSVLLAQEGFQSYYVVPLKARDQVKGVMEIFNHTHLDPAPEWLNVMESLASQAAIAIDNAALFESLEQSHDELETSYDATLEGWAKALELRDYETEGHSQRVMELTVKLGRVMNLEEDELVHLRRGALLHDIGKMGIPDNILQKKGPFNDKEREIMQQHPVNAYQMLSSIRYLRPALDIPQYHHEKWDGSGYPRGLKGERIPLAARIFSVVDVWDALTSNRPYREAWSKEKTLDYIRSQAGKAFDPKIVGMMLRIAN